MIGRVCQEEPWELCEEGSELRIRVTGCLKGSFSMIIGGKIIVADTFM